MQINLNMQGFMAGAPRVEYVRMGDGERRQPEPRHAMQSAPHARAAAPVAHAGQGMQAWDAAGAVPVVPPGLAGHDAAAHRQSAHAQLEAPSFVLQSRRNPMATFSGHHAKVSNALTIPTWALLIITIWCATDTADDSQPGVNRTCASFITIPIILLLGAYAVYLVTGFLTFAHVEVRRAYAPDSVTDRLQRLRAAAPGVRMQTNSYHYEPRQHTVSRRLPSGGSTVSLETVNEHVSSHFETVEFQYQSWTDESSDLHDLHSYRICHVALSKSFRFGSAAAAEQFKAQAAALCDRNRGRDEHMSYTESMHVPGFAESMSGLVDARKGLPYLLSERWYFVFLLLGLRWPYYWWYSSLVTTRTFHLCKVLH